MTSLTKTFNPHAGEGTPDRLMPMGLLFARTVKYCYLDSNLHVNTVRYVEMILNGFTPEFHTANPLEAEIQVDGQTRVRFTAKLQA